MDTTTNPTRHLTCAETAKILRAELKAKYPGVKFSVRSKTYTGGASITVEWTDGPVERSYNRHEYVTMPDGTYHNLDTHHEGVWNWLQQFAGADFDGMVDLKTYRDPMGYKGEYVSFGADYIFTRRNVGDEERAKLTALAEDYYGEPMQANKLYDLPVAQRDVFGSGMVEAMAAHPPLVQRMEQIIEGRKAA